MIWRLVDREKAAESGAMFDLVPHQVGEKGNGHGMAIGDISGDGSPTYSLGRVGMSNPLPILGHSRGLSMQTGSYMQVFP